MDRENYIYIMEYCSAIKNNEVMLFASKWMEVEIVLSKVSQTQKDKYCMFSLICGSQTYKVNVHINTYMYIHKYIHKYIYIYVCEYY
jgi:hypothetical protein